MEHAINKKKNSMQQRENRYRRPLSGGKSGPSKPVVKTDRSEVKSPASLTRVLGVSSRSEEEDGWGKSEDEADAV